MSDFQRRHYETIARALERIRRLEVPVPPPRSHGQLTTAEAAKRDTINAVTREIADTFERDNRRFNRDRFLEAAGLDDNDPDNMPPAVREQFDDLHRADCLQAGASPHD